MNVNMRLDAGETLTLRDGGTVTWSRRDDGMTMVEYSWRLESNGRIDEALEGADVDACRGAALAFVREFAKSYATETHQLVSDIEGVISGGVWRMTPCPRCATQHGPDCPLTDEEVRWVRAAAMPDSIRRDPWADLFRSIGALSATYAGNSFANVDAAENTQRGLDMLRQRILDEGSPLYWRTPEQEVMARAAALLDELEWSGGTGGKEACPSCDADRRPAAGQTGPHADGCKLVASHNSLWYFVPGGRGRGEGGP